MQSISPAQVRELQQNPASYLQDAAVRVTVSLTCMWQAAAPSPALLQSPFYAEVGTWLTNANHPHSLFSLVDDTVHFVDPGGEFFFCSVSLHSYKFHLFFCWNTECICVWHSQPPNFSQAILQMFQNNKTDWRQFPLVRKVQFISSFCLIIVKLHFLVLKSQNYWDIEGIYHIRGYVILYTVPPMTKLLL